VEKNGCALEECCVIEECVRKAGDSIGINARCYATPL
jgi:hypothetical protein